MCRSHLIDGGNLGEDLRLGVTGGAWDYILELIAV